MTPSSELRRCVQALAQPSEVQRQLYPDFVCVGDELALGFDDACRAFRSASPQLSESQAGALAALDELLDDLSAPDRADFWLDPERLASDPAWARVRAAARAVLVAFGWPEEVPQKNGATYVSKACVVGNR